MISWLTGLLYLFPGLVSTHGHLVSPHKPTQICQDRDIYDFATELFKRQSAWSSSAGFTREGNDGKSQNLVDIASEQTHLFMFFMFLLGWWWWWYILDDKTR